MVCVVCSCTGKSAESILAWHTCPQVLILHLLRYVVSVAKEVYCTRTSLLCIIQCRSCIEGVNTLIDGQFSLAC